MSVLNNEIARANAAEDWTIIEYPTLFNEELDIGVFTMHIGLFQYDSATFCDNYLGSVDACADFQAGTEYDADENTGLVLGARMLQEDYEFASDATFGACIVENAMCFGYTITAANDDDSSSAL
jgi:hypothetical protein